MPVAFGAWKVTTQTARCTWSVTGDAMAVMVAISKGDAEPGWLNRTGATGTESVGVALYVGSVTLRVRVRDSLGEWTETQTSVEVDNSVPASAPDALWYEYEAPLTYHLRWAAAVISPSVGHWLVYNITAEGETLLAQVPVGTMSVDIPAVSDVLRRVVVRGATAAGVESLDSPALPFGPVPGGPRITVGPWRVGSDGAVAVRWLVASRSFLRTVRYRLVAGDVVSQGTGGSVGQASLTAPDYSGDVRLEVVARDSQDREVTVVATQSVVTSSPPMPALGVLDVTRDSVGLRGIPGQGPVATAQIQFSGPGLSRVAASPFEVTFTGLRAATAYTFRARAINASGLPGLASDELTVTTLADPGAEPAEPDLGYLPQLDLLLTRDCLSYLIQTYSATFLRVPALEQIVTPPVGFDDLLNYFLPLAADFGAIIRAETGDQESYEASEEIDALADPIAKLVVWCERLVFGNIWERA